MVQTEAVIDLVASYAEQQGGIHVPGQFIMFDMISWVASLNSKAHLNGNCTVLNFITCSPLFLVGFHSGPASLFSPGFYCFLELFKGKESIHRDLLLFTVYTDSLYSFDPSKLFLYFCQFGMQPEKIYSGTHSWVDLFSISELTVVLHSM